MDEAIRTLCARHLHQRLWLPETASHGRLRVTFSTTSNFDDSSLPAVLFCVPMFGSRWLALEVNKLAETEGVRLIFVDRPGMGGSAEVPLNMRMQVWLETVPVILQTLDVQHAALVCHSAGTIYLLNTLYHHRDILDPKAPYVACIAPWVHNKHSNAFLMNLASKVPNGMFNSWNSVNQFIATRIAPSVGWSGGIITSITNLFQAEAGSTESDPDTAATKYGTSKEVAEQIQKLQTKYYFAENTSAGNQDALMCLKKGEPDLWGVSEDFQKYVENFTKLEHEHRRKNELANEASKLKLRVFYAESDALIGKGGQVYFEKCWSAEGVSNVIDVAHEVLPGTNHDSALIDHAKGAWRKVFRGIKEGRS